ncbi:hypothetical protein P170DRAFT_380493 [Aspergillus steynii IBT 23096]|uniref:Zn(2)-C6 fungal-type domain-containing protein n=1 Tax=Aspergillus steynii IBT 23096 TaxID=1392250 RepID=A0A2I2GB89_9EURO|nr:uncharacterized protein P170DRAFT_380493 [Aspergillus steynii IBT 23096]PLB50117.1 hypothetical protein P170DRAFT_380493 [Aspergillus steynii IBT 23096]
MSTPRQRSHHSCWTCKARRRKCDRGRPACRVCSDRGILCEGYEVRLRWGSGIASRGRFTGAGEPVVASVPVRVKGRRRDLTREGIGLGLHVEGEIKSSMVLPMGQEYRLGDSPSESSGRSPESCSGRSTEGERLFQEFLSFGIHILHSTTVHDEGNLLAPRLPELCRQSEALYAICLALQASISESNPRFLEYFDAALNQFRTELARSMERLSDGTFTAGLLLCSIGLVHGLPWTMHLHGIHTILQHQGLDTQYRQQSPFRSHLHEVMGVMDLPSFAIGRQNPPLGFWRRYCRNRGGIDDVEVVSGLPRSLLDIFSCVGEGGATEEDFWDWPGSQGSFLQCQLWEAYRLAGMLTVRYAQLHGLSGQAIGSRSRSRSLSTSKSQSRARERERERTLPSTKVLVLRILSCLDAIARGSIEPDGKDSLVLNAIHYPIFVTGLQTGILDEDPGLKQVLRGCVALRRSRAEVGRDGQVLMDLLEEWWQSDRETSVHQLAQSRALELGLL